MARKRNKILYIYVDERLKAQVMAVVGVLDLDQSKLMRDALSKHLETLSQENKAVKKALRQVA